MCNHQKQMLCSEAQGKMRALLLGAAGPKQTDSSVVPLQIHLPRFAGHTGVQAPVHCSTVQGEMHALLLCAARPIKLTASLCHGKYTYQGLQDIQVCNHQAAMHCSVFQRRMHAWLLWAAMQNKLTAILCHKCTRQDLLCIQVCRNHAPMRC